VHIMMVNVGRISGNYQFTPAQTLLKAKVQNAGVNFPIKLWETIQGQALWEIWKGKGGCHFELIIPPVQQITASIWSKIREYMHIEWQDLGGKHKAGKISIDKAKNCFYRRFGLDSNIVSFINGKINIVLLLSLL
jgi:hypothetical protein